MKHFTKTTLHTTLGELIEGLYNETKALLGNEEDTSVVVAFILNDLMAKQGFRGQPWERQPRQRKTVTDNETETNRL